MADGKKQSKKAETKKAAKRQSPKTKKPADEHPPESAEDFEHVLRRLAAARLG